MVFKVNGVYSRNGRGKIGREPEVPDIDLNQESHCLSTITKLRGPGITPGLRVSGLF